MYLCSFYWNTSVAWYCTELLVNKRRDASSTLEYQWHAEVDTLPLVLKKKKVRQTQLITARAYQDQRWSISDRSIDPQVHYIKDLISTVLVLTRVACNISGKENAMDIWCDIQSHPTRPRPLPHPKPHWNTSVGVIFNRTVDLIIFSIFLRRLQPLSRISPSF